MRGLYHSAGLAIVIALAAAMPSNAVAAPPPNDAFAAAEALEGLSGERSSTNKDATRETGEPAHAGNAGGGSVWYRWAAQGAGTVTIETAESTFDTLLAVYTGTSVDTLTEVASNDDFEGRNDSLVTFKPIAGTVYLVAVDGFDGARGPFKVRWRQAAANDDFAAAQPLEGISGSVGGTTAHATTEPGEPAHADWGASVWYRWIAPKDGKIVFRTSESEGDPTLTVYSGRSIDALTEIASNDDTGGDTFESLVGFDFASGTEYFVAVGEYGDGGGSFRLNWHEGHANDDFRGAQVIAGAAGRVTGSNRFATTEPGESTAYDSSASLWYRWRAPTTGHVRFETVGSGLDTVLAVYTGNAVNDLTRVAANDDFGGLTSGVSFRAVAGRTYSIAVTGYEGERGDTVLRWYPGAIIRGTRRQDTITGTSGRDYIAGGAGNDVLSGGAGADVIIGGPGADVLQGGQGNDTLDSRDSVRRNDVIGGGPGTDRATADRGDRIYGVP